MKKILSILLVALLLVGMLPMNALHTHAVEKTAEISFASTTQRASVSTSEQVWNSSDGVVTFTHNKGTGSNINSSYYNPLRVYANSKFTVSCTGGNITKIVVTCSSSSYATALGNSTFSDAKASVSGSTVTITPNNATQTSCTASKISAQTRFTKLVVHYEAASACQHANTTTTTVDATCTAAGSTTVTCNDCNETVSETTIDALGHNYVDGVCQNCNNKLYVVSFSVPSQVAAVESLVADENTGKVTLPAAADYTGKYAYTFAGWAKNTVAETSTAPTLYAAGSQYTPDGDTTLYAVYTRTEGGSGEAGYVLTDIADISPTDVVVITMTKGTTVYALPNDGGASTPDAEIITLTDGKLTTVADNLKWNIGGTANAYIFYPNGNTSSWLYCTNSNSGVRVGTDSGYNTFKINSDYIYNNERGRYLGVYTANPDWRSYTSINSNITGQTLGFYVYSAGGTTYYTSTLEDLNVECQHTNTTENTVDATCTEAGSITVTCDDCGAQVSITEIPPKGHTAVTDAAVAPTCVDTGLTEGSHCSVCNTVLVEQQTVAATGKHTYSGGVCTVCGAEKAAKAWQLVTDVNEIYAGGQFVVVGYISDTESYALPTAISSKMNGAAVTIADNKVVFVEGTTPVWTIESLGGTSFALTNGTSYLKYASSTNLGSSTTAYGFTLTAVGDSFKVVASGDNSRGLVFRAKSYNQFGGYALTNVTGASTEYYGIRFYKLVNLCDHENVADVAAVTPTCTSVGYTAGKQCTDCGAYTKGHEEVAMIDHNYEGVVTTAPGCETTGVKTYTCTACGNSYEETLEAAGHVMGDAVILEATCTEKGSKTFTCTVCSESQTEEIPALGHAWDEGETTLQPDCENKGEILYTCQNDPSHTKTEKIDALGHNWDEGVQTQAPTCDVPGMTLHTCLNDPSHTKEEAIHPLGHQFENGVCSVCGKEVSRFQLVTDYTEILAGGDYIVAAKVGDKFYAINGGTDTFKKAYPLTVEGTGTDMMVIYADGIPYWNIQYFLGRNNCISLYNAASGKYLKGTDSTSLSSDTTTPWAWTFIDGSNKNGQETDGTFAVTQADGSVAYVLASATISDRAISLKNTDEFMHYSVRTSGYNRELYFFKMVKANATEYTVNFVENGITTMTLTVPAENSGLKMPQPTGANPPEGYTKFAGWAEIPHTESMIAPANIYSAEEGDGFNNTVVITEDKTFYALYSREDPDGEGQTMDYHLVTDHNQLVVGQKYIIVGLDKNGNYYAMSQNQLSGDRGAALVFPDENGVISFTPADNVAAFELTQGAVLDTFGFLDLAMNQFLYCASTGSENTLKSQAALDEKASFEITIAPTEDGSYSIIISQVAESTTTRNILMFNTIDTASKMFSCYGSNTTVDQTRTFLYVGVPNSTFATYYTTGLCAHDWTVKEQQVADCENPGYTLYHCLICGELKMEDVQAHGHDVGASQVTTQPTCTTTGIATSTCNKCGKTFEETISALGHTEVTDAAVAADCLNTGLTEGKHCSVCGTVTVPQQEVAALGHREVIDEAVAATCTTAGKTEGKHCDRCGEVLVVQNEISALGHKYEGAVEVNDNRVPVLTYTCSACGDSYSIALRFSAADLKLQNSLIIGFRTNTDIAGQDGFTNIRATFQYGSRELMTVNLEDTDLIDGRYQFLCRYITPSQIGDTVYATLYGTYNGVEYSYEMEYGVSQYCYNMLANENSSQDLKNLLVDMLYYCDAARVYTNYKPDEPITNQLTEEQKGFATADRTYTSVLNAKYAVIANPTASWKAASLVMYHSTRMQLRFAVAEGVDISKVTAKVMVGNEEKIGYIAASDDYAGQYLVIIDDIAARQQSDVVYVTLYQDGTAISNTITYSVESYAYAKQNDKNVKLAVLVKALMHYGDSANAYLN